MSNTKTVERIEAFKKEFLAEGSECTWKDYPLATDVLDWLRLQEKNFHQELQKAREEEKEVIKSIIRVAKDSAEVDRIASQRLRDLSDQSELDQDK